MDRLPGRRAALAAVVTLTLALVLLGLGVSRRTGPRAGDPTLPAIAFTARPSRPPEASRPPVPVAAGAVEVEVEVDGLVIDTEDRPVGDALVIIDAEPPRSTRTDAQGRWAFQGLSPRRYALVAASGDRSAGPVSGEFLTRQDPVVLRLSTPPRPLEVSVVSAATGEPISGATVRARGVTEVRQSTDELGLTPLMLITGVDPIVQLTVTAKGHADLHGEVTLPPGGGSVTVELDAGLPLEILVVTRDGRKPVERATISLRRRGMDLLNDGATASATTDASGLARVPGLASGRWELSVHHSDFDEHKTDFAAGESARLVVELSAGVDLVGRVVEPTGEPTVDAHVIAMGPNRSTQTDETGAFKLMGLRPRLVELRASARGVESLPVPVDLTSGRAPGLVTITMPGPGVIAGRVVDQQNRPVDADVTTSLATNHTISQQTRTKKDGTFRFTRLGASKSWTVRAERLKYFPDNPNPFHDLATPRVEATLGQEDLTLRLPAPATVAGRVAFKDGSTPDGFKVSLGSEILEAQGATGAFRLSPIPPGSQLLRVTGDDFNPYEKWLEVKEGQHLDLGAVIVSRGRTVRGRVVTTAGKAVEGADVLFEGHSTSTRALTAISSADGRFELHGITEEETWLTAEHATLGRATERHLPAGEASETVELVLKPSAQLTGRLALSAQDPPDLRVKATLLGDERLHVTARVGTDGRFALEGLVPGRWVLQAEPSGGFFIEHWALLLAGVVQVSAGELDLGLLELPRRRAVRMTASTSNLVLLIPLGVPARDAFDDSAASRVAPGRAGSWHMVGLGPNERVVKNLVPGRMQACQVVRDTSGAPAPRCAELTIPADGDEVITLP